MDYFLYLKRQKLELYSPFLHFMVYTSNVNWLKDPILCVLIVLTWLCRSIDPGVCNIVENGRNLRARSNILEKLSSVVVAEKCFNHTKYFFTLLNSLGSRANFIVFRKTLYQICDLAVTLRVYCCSTYCDFNRYEITFQFTNIKEVLVSERA